MSEFPLQPSEYSGNHTAPLIKVIGAGGGGSNAVNRMFRTPIPGVEYIVVNTDSQALQRCDTPMRIQVGERLTRGLGVGGDPETGRLAAEESREHLTELLRGADMVFVAAGMGGGTGTGTAPIIAEIAKETGALTVGVVTKPFSFEGTQRRKLSEDGVHRLKDKVDSLIVIPNDRLIAISDEKVTMSSAFALADDVLLQSVQSIAELITVPGEINLDFADVKTVMTQAGPSWLGIGTGSGEKRAIIAAKAAVACPLLEVSIEGATGVLFNVTGGNNLTLSEVNNASEAIQDLIDPDANIFFGMVTDPKMEDEVRVTIIATGFPTMDTMNSTREEDLAELISNGSGNGETRELEIDLPPFLRKSSSFARNRVTSRLNGL